MSIVNIFNISDNGRAGYKQQIDVILYLERIIEQNVHNRDYYCHGVVTESNKESWIMRQRKYLIPLIRSQVTQSKGVYVSQYIFDLFAHFCRSKTDFIDLSCIHEERPFMCRPLQNIFFIGKPQQRQLNGDRIKDLFPRLKAYRDEHGLLKSVAQIPPSHQWYDDLERTDEEKAVFSTTNEFDESADTEADEMGLGISEHKDDEKRDVQQPRFKKRPKPHPAEFFADQFPDKKHPNGTPSFIEFKWNRKFTKIEQCDTIHMLYLLQCACELHRKRVIERNKYFESIGRADRYIAHVDTPQIITNFIIWHNEDKEKNVFTGQMLKPQKEMVVIKEFISRIGDVKMGEAARIFQKLTKEVKIEHDEWTETGTQNKLKLETWGLTKMYLDMTVLEECTVEQIVILFTYRAPEVEEKKEDAEQVQYVFLLQIS